ncbi:MAG: cobyrinate a,c-diamide synthase [Pseudolabrys sp.]
MTARGFIVAAPGSGAGKTTIALGLVAALRRRGVTVRTAKAGPDYIDPAFHAVASGAPCVNLDSWAMPPAMLDALAADQARAADVVVIEGVMGLFDGVAASPGRTGSTAELAAHFGLPVALVVNVAGQSQSAAAVVRGFSGHDPAVRVAGVILNNVASDRHRAYAADAVSALGVPVLGAVPRNIDLKLPERHLGLVQAGEHGDLAAYLDRLAMIVTQHVDLDLVLQNAGAFVLPVVEQFCALAPPGQRIALARDEAFSFIYPHVLAAWRRAGAEIVTFSPLADEVPPPDCDCCWLPGGYPELRAGKLAAARYFRDGLKAFGETRPVHGECGGYMVLGEALIDAAGIPHAMTGLLGHTTSFANRKLHLGYREAVLLGDSPLGRAGGTVRGHEFHYATLTAAGQDEPLAELRDGQGRALGPSGGRRGHITGTFFHVIAQQETA